MTPSTRDRILARTLARTRWLGSPGHAWYRHSPLLLSLLLLFGCAPTVRDPWGLALTRGHVPAQPAPPESLQADLGIQPRGAGALPVTGRLYALPLRSYRLDVFGFPSVAAASWLWRDRRWILLRHDLKQARAGTGDALEIEGFAVRLPDVHEALGFLWGRPLPDHAFADTLFVRPGGTVRWRRGGETWEADFDPATGLCLEVRSPELSLRYRRHREHAGRVVAGEAELFLRGVPVLLLRVRELSFAPGWLRDPFVLSVPPSYHRSGE